MPLCQNVCLLPSRHPIHSSLWAASLTPACCWFKMCFGKESKGPDGSLLSSMSPANSHFTAAAQLQGSWGGPAKYLDLVPMALERREETGAESLRQPSAVVPEDRCWWRQTHPAPPPFLSSLLLACLRFIHRTIFEVFEIWVS